MMFRQPPLAAAHLPHIIDRAAMAPELPQRNGRAKSLDGVASRSPCLPERHDEPPAGHFVTFPLPESTSLLHRRGIVRYSSPAERENLERTETCVSFGCINWGD